MLSLSKRETEVSGYLALGLTEKEIANKLFLSIGTIRSHKKNIYRKIEARSIADVARIISELVTKLNISQLIREHMIDPNARKVVTVIFFLFLQLTATFEQMDIRPNRGRTSSTTRTARVRRVEA